MSPHDDQVLSPFRPVLHPEAHGRERVRHRDVRRLPRANLEFSRGGRARCAPTQRRSPRGPSPHVSLRSNAPPPAVSVTRLRDNHALRSASDVVTPSEPSSGSSFRPNAAEFIGRNPEKRAALFFSRSESPSRRARRARATPETRVRGSTRFRTRARRVIHARCRSPAPSPSRAPAVVSPRATASPSHPRKARRRFRWRQIGHLDSPTARARDGRRERDGRHRGAPVRQHTLDHGRRGLARGSRRAAPRRAPSLETRRRGGGRGPIHRWKSAPEARRKSDVRDAVRVRVRQPGPNFLS